MNIELKNVSKTFEKPVLSSFSHVFNGNSIHCILGESGCGKSTLLKLIGGIWQPDAGEIVFSQKHKISYMFQEDRLLPWLSAFENVLAVKNDSKACSLIFEKLEIKDAKNLYPNELSGGMKRRVALSRALAYDGDIFLLDEPFSGIDTATKLQIMQYIKPLLITKLCIVISHDKEEAVSLGAAVYTMKNDCLLPIT